MAEQEQMEQQNFVPERKPNLWHRFLFWLASFTPKHKKALVLVFLIIAVAIAGIVYLALAGEDMVFSIREDGGATQLILGTRRYFINVDLTAKNTTDIVAADMVLTYNDDVFDPTQESTEIVPVLNNPTYDGTHTVFDAVVIDRVANEITLVTSIQFKADYNAGVVAARNFVLANRGATSTILTIEVEPANTGTLNFTFANPGVNGAQVYIGPDPSGMITTDPNVKVVNASFRVIASSASTGLYLDPDAGDEFDIFNVDIVLDTMGRDVVAVSTDIAFDPQVLVLENVIKNKSFPIAGVEVNNKGVGSFQLVRGTYGDSNNGNGTLEPEVNATGANGRLVVATLRFRPIVPIDNSSISTQVTLTNSQIIADDGSGTLLTADDASGNYTIRSTPFNAKLIIIQGPEVQLVKEGNTWVAEIYWETNREASTVLNQSPGGSLRKISSTVSLDHGITLSGLSEGTYNYTISSQANCSVDQDPADCIVTAGGTFDVGEKTSNLVIKNLSAKASFNSATISWNTEGGANNGLANGRIVSCSTALSGTYEDLNYNLTHSFQLNGLANNQDYSCTVRSEDEGGGVATGNVQFTTKAGLGFDANVVLKVEPDRVCDKWLYCRSSMMVKNNKDLKNPYENLCFDVGVCDEKDSNGVCSAGEDLSQVLAGAAEQTFNSPGGVSRIENLSGMAKVGLDWGSGKIIKGYYNYSNMITMGADIKMPNGDFESGDVWPWKGNKADLDIQTKNNSSVLVIRPQAGVQSSDFINAEAEIGTIARKAGYVYAVSMGVWSSDPKPREVSIELRIGQSNYATLQNVTITNAPQTIVLTSNQKGSEFTANGTSGKGYLIISAYKDPTIYRNEEEIRFYNDIYVDNISMKSVLEVSSFKKVARSCRLYPSNDAVACDYNNESGKEQRGWKGFCVEEDPKYRAENTDQVMCLNWWPVDILPGETDVFGQDTLAGYLGRRPLYYCEEAEGNYPYVRETRSGNSGDGYAASLMYRYCSRNDTTSWRSIIPSYAQYIVVKNIYDIVNNNTMKTCGWGRASGRWTSLAPDERSFRDVDIERIILEPLCEEGDDDKDCFSKKVNDAAYIVLNRNNQWQGFMCNGSNCHNADYYFNPDNHFWDNQPSMLSNNDICGKSGVDLFAVRAVFDDQNKFIGLDSGLCNGAGDDDTTGFVRYNVTFYLREVCNVLAEVVTPDGENMAWAGKIGNGRWLTTNDDNKLGYNYQTDYTPYGAAVVGADNLTDPSKWEQPLYVMPAEKDWGFDEPYQVRAGTPYGVSGTAPKYCTNGQLDGAPCSVDSDCDSYVIKNMTPVLVPGKCELTINSLKIGKAQCISADGDNLGKVCTTSNDCGYSLGSGYGLCMGITLNNQALNNIYGGYKTGQVNLQNLFAKSYRVWRWAFQDGEWKYVEVENTGDYGWDISMNYSANKPRVGNIRVNGERSGDLEISNMQNIKLEFNSFVDMQHEPLTAFRVDWGDGSPITQVSNLRIQAHSATSTPHVLFHSYSCTGSCSYVPRIQIEDNWGWCSNGTTAEKCDDTVSTWDGFNGTINIR